MSSPVCGSCRWAYTEDWPKGMSALRCGSAGPHRGHVTSLYPSEKKAVVAEREAPRWCCKWKEGAG